MEPGTLNLLFYICSPRLIQLHVSSSLFLLSSQTIIEQQTKAGVFKLNESARSRHYPHPPPKKRLEVEPSSGIRHLYVKALVANYKAQKDPDFLIDRGLASLLDRPKENRAFSKNARFEQETAMS